MDLGVELGRALKMPVDALWNMQNGYCLCTGEGLTTITDHLHAIDPKHTSALAGLLRIGLQSDVELTDGSLPVAYKATLPVWARSATSVGVR